MSVSYTFLDVDDNINLSDGEYILEDDGFICTTKGQKEISPSPFEDNQESIFDTLRSIQEGNPNIEAVFVEESDEEASRNFQTSPQNTPAEARPAFSTSSRQAIFEVEADEEENDENEEDSAAASRNFLSLPENKLAKSAFSRSRSEAILQDGSILASRNFQTSRKSYSARCQPAKVAISDAESIQNGNEKFQARPRLEKTSALSEALSRSNVEEIFEVESEEEENNISGEDTSSASETNTLRSSPKTALPEPVTTPNANQKVNNASVTQTSPPKLNATPNTPTLPSSTNRIPSQNANPSPLRVKEVPSATLTSNFMKNSNTIVLNSPNSSAKQILVIPNEVLPFIASSTHPIRLNVPGIGSVVINKSKTSMPRPQPVKKVPDPPAYDPLCDNKYQFWRYRKGIKRDLEGFSINDRLGFFKAEQSRSKMCMIYYENAIKKIKGEIEVLSKKFGLLWKPVEIDKVKSARKATRKSITVDEKDNLTPLQKKNLHVIKKWKEHFNKKSSKKTESSSSPEYEKTDLSSSSEEDENLLVRKKRLERKRRREATKQKIKRKTAAKKKTKNEKSSDVELSPHENPYLKKYNTYQNTNPCKIIDTLKDLELEMNPDKPVIVFNKKNYSRTNFEKLRLKNNLVYPSATEKGIPKILVNNAAMYNLWFVKPDILDKYLAGRKQ